VVEVKKENFGEGIKIGKGENKEKGFKGFEGMEKEKRLRIMGKPLENERLRGLRARKDGVNMYGGER